VEHQNTSMRILVSLENEQNLDKLIIKLCNFLSIIEDDKVFVDILHVFKDAKGHIPNNLDSKIDEINLDTFNMKVKLISDCENQIEHFLQNKLKKKALVNSHLLKGNYKERLEKHIKFHNYDLLILNPGKKRDFDLILKGRNTHWIIDNLEVPVLVLPHYLKSQEDCPYEITCFVDDAKSFRNISNAQLIKKIKNQNVRFMHFGKHKISDEVEIVFSSNILKSLSNHTTSCDNNHVFVVNHKNKGKFLKFLDKGFTKNLINSLENPLLIF